jgi:hypothetical protein
MKKVIRYLQAYMPPVVGQGAFIALFDDHPNCQTKDVITSAVQSIDGTTIETLNTTYVKYDQE